MHVVHDHIPEPYPGMRQQGREKDKGGDADTGAHYPAVPRQVRARRINDECAIFDVLLPPFGLLAALAPASPLPISGSPLAFLTGFALFTVQTCSKAKRRQRLLPPEPCRLRQGKVWSLGEAGMHYSYAA